MKIRHMTKGYSITVSSKRGKPVISKGFVMIQGGNYMGCDSISEEVMHRDFKWDGKDS